MRIGVDFDNTIICYDSVFYTVAKEKNLIPTDIPPSKGPVRDYLRNIGKEDAWTELQGAIYGKHINDASAFPGVFNFFHFCKNNNIRIFIISHKTRYPYLGPKYDLHQAAYQWLELHGFIKPNGTNISANDIFFESTKENKMNRIAVTRCTHFIDDLPEFLSEPGFPPDVNRILFDPNKNYDVNPGLMFASSWYEIMTRFQAEINANSN
jgi:hypothetical protein